MPPGLVLSRRNTATTGAWSPLEQNGHRIRIQQPFVDLEHAFAEFEHDGVCQGIFDFSGLFDYLRANDLRPIITLEPHQEEGLWDSLSALARMELPEPAKHSSS